MTGRHLHHAHPSGYTGEITAYRDSQVYVKSIANGPLKYLKHYQVSGTDPVTQSPQSGRWCPKQPL